MKKARHIVTVANDLTEARFKLHLNSYRLVLSFIKQIVNNPKNDIFEEVTTDKIYTMNVNDYADLWGQQRKYTYEVLSEAGKELFEARLSLRHTVDVLTEFRWISWIKYDREKGEISVKWTPDLIPLISKVREYGDFSSFLLEAMQNLSTYTAMRLYTLVSTKMRLKTEDKSVQYSIEQLKIMFKLEDSYPLYGQFKQKVLDPAVLDINTNSDIGLSYKEIKEGKKVIGILFTPKTRLKHEKG